MTTSRYGRSTRTRWTRSRTRPGSPVAWGFSDVAGRARSRCQRVRDAVRRRVAGRRRQGHGAHPWVARGGADGTIYQIEFDPRAYPERTSGAEIIGSRFYHAIGFNTAESYLVDVDPEQVFVIPDATVEVKGRRLPFTGLDINDVLERSARRPDGKYRAVASRFIDGRNLGPFRYYGTRADDPNDLFPHEHRRELRANRVFAAWLNHVDSRGINSLDALVGRKARNTSATTCSTSGRSSVVVLVWPTSPGLAMNIFSTGEKASRRWHRWGCMFGRG